MFAVPAPTNFDLKFSLLGIPVRVHPYFWALAALVGWGGRDGSEILVWIACVFVSVLLHEFGHALTARRLAHQQPAVILFLMGGLCVYDRDHRSPWRRIVILLMGPGAGFLLFGLLAVGGMLVLGVIPFGGGIVKQPPEWLNSPLVLEAYSDLLGINLIWGIFNLLPIFPFDGGQIVYTLFAWRNPVHGPRWCYIVSIGTAALVATFFYTVGAIPNALLIGYLGLMNFQYLQATRFQSRYGDGSAEDDNWWRK